MRAKHWTAVLITLFALSLIGLAVVALAAPGAQAGLRAASPFVITAHQPVTHEVGVALTANISATFDEDVNASTVTSRTFAVHGHLGGLASGTFAYDGGTRTVTLDPDRPFHAGEELRVTATDAISSSGGAALTPYGWQFTAGEVYSRCVAGFADTHAALAGVFLSSVAWGDYDNDGDLDILLTGYDGSAGVSKVYRNDAVGGFTETIGADLTGVADGSVAWGDYDNDGDLDILLTGGGTSGPLSKVYRNDGGGTFEDIAADLAPVMESSVAWGDYDNDGDLDILLTGWDASTPVSRVYRNDGGSTFTEIAAGLTPVYRGSVAWGDCDNDGDLDILLTGWDGSPVSKVYRNDAGGTFTEIAHGLTPVHRGSVAWGDYDNDGDLDILLTGEDSGGNRLSKVYRNDGPSGFTDIGVGLTGVRYSSVAWGDYDNDGDLDILLTGESGSGYVSKVYRNDGGTFTDRGAGLTGVYVSSVAWGDYDNDGDLDILLTGATGSIAVSKVYRNDDCVDLVMSKSAQPISVLPGASIAYTLSFSNSGPMTATGVVITDIVPAEVAVSSVVSSGVAITDTGATPPYVWQVADLGPERGGWITVTGVVSPELLGGWVFTNSAEIATAVTESKLDDNRAQVAVYTPWRIIAHEPPRHAVGVPLTSPIQATFDEDVNASTVTSRTLAVHGHLGGLASGTFSYDGGTRTVTLDPNRAFHAGEVLRVSATSAISSTAAVPLTPYGWQFTAGEVYPRYHVCFVDTHTALTGVGSSSAAWADCDNDGDLDILLTGWTGNTQVSNLYRNEGGAAFTDSDAGPTAVLDSSVAWGDYDNDGDLDILLTGRNGLTPVSKVYRNDGAGAFTDIGAGVTAVHSGSVAWGDYDSDGDLDILLTGFVGPSSYVSKVYRNDGGTFADIGAGLTGVCYSSVAWGDYDNDGDLDILLTGYRGGAPVSKVYRNDGGASGFTDVGAGLTAVEHGSVAWGDYDNDGDLDILLTGQDNAYDPVSKVYRNDGGASGFTDVPAGLTAVFYSSVAWGDYDNDGDLDILLTGWDNAYEPVSKVYRNDGGTFADIGAGLTGVRESSVAWGDYDNDGDLDILLTGWSSGFPVSRVYRNRDCLPGVRYVKPNVYGDCSSWANACTLQAALGNAGVGDEIWVATGTYKPTDGTDRKATFHLVRGVGVYGGFVGTETSRDDRNTTTNITLLSGDIDNNDITAANGMITDTANIAGANSYHVVTGSDITETAVLDGFTITGGSAEAGVGGGMYNEDSSPTLRNLTFSGNRADDGGGMYNLRSSPVLMGTHFFGNSAEDGGGMYNASSSPVLINLTLSGNSAQVGGGLANFNDSDPVVANSILWGNVASPGAQIHNSDATSTPIISCSLVQGCGGSGDPWDDNLGTDGGGNIDDAPHFVDADGGDLHLACASPAIDAGDNSAVPASVTTDLDGNPRISGIPGSARVDMGAYEEQYYEEQATLGDIALTEGQAYRTGFHYWITKTITATLAAYDDSLFRDAYQYYANALQCAPTPERVTYAFTGRLDAGWELATGEMLAGNQDVVEAVDPRITGAYPSLENQISELSDARAHYADATDIYEDLLAGEWHTQTLAFQPGRVSPLSGEPEPYADLQRLAEAAAKKSGAYVALAERYFRQNTSDSRDDAQETLVEGWEQAAANLALLSHLAEGWSAEVSASATVTPTAYEAAYQALTQNIADMQRIHSHLLEGKSPFGYDAAYVPFYPVEGTAEPEGNFEYWWGQASYDDPDHDDYIGYDRAFHEVNLLLASDRRLDEDEDELFARLDQLDEEYQLRLDQLCGVDDYEGCHNGEIAAQVDRIEAAGLRVERVYVQMENQAALIRIEQQRAASVKGIHEAVAAMYLQTGEELASLARQEAELKHTKSAMGGFMDILTGGMMGFRSGASFGAKGAIAGAGLGMIVSAGQWFDQNNTGEQLADVAEKRARIEAYQEAEVRYADARIEDANSEALIKEYLLEFALLDLDLAIALNGLRQEIARLEGMKTEVEYLLARWADVRRDYTSVFIDPAERVFRDQQAERASKYFDLALETTYRAARALDYEMAQTWASEADVYALVGTQALDDYLVAMNQEYQDWYAHGNSWCDAIKLSQAMGFDDSWVISGTERVWTTAQQKFEQYVSDPENWVDLDGNGDKESLQLTFETSLLEPYRFFSRNVYNDKIRYYNIVLMGEDESKLDKSGDGTRVALRQAGSSAVRDSSSDPYGEDSYKVYNLEATPPHQVAAMYNSGPTVCNDVQPYAGYGLYWRSVYCTKWVLTIDLTGNEPVNWNEGLNAPDVDLAGVDEIKVHVRHRDFPLNSGGLLEASPPRKRSVPTAARLAYLASDPEVAHRFAGTLYPQQPENLPPQPLAVLLVESGGVVTGAIESDALPGYPVDPVTGLGPGLSGTVEDGRFLLSSDVYTVTSAAITHQLILTTTSATTSTLSGDYVERIGGLTPVPLEITGTYTLTRSSVGPQAAFTAGPASGPVPLVVTFTNWSVGDPTHWAWDFGDGAISAQQHPTHTYTAMGSYTVTLTVSNTFGVTTTIEPNYISVVSSKPALGEVDPSSGSGPTGVTTFFTTTWTDPNGWEDLKQCWFHIGASPSIVGNVTLLYNAVKDKLWLRSDDGSAWTGGYAPESANTLENSQAIVHCGLTTAAGSGDTLTVVWAIEFKPGYTGTKKLGLKCKDRSKARAKARWKGTWTIE
jgi:uncharacterized repeat protein (TIGR01451 family)